MGEDGLDVFEEAADAFYAFLAIHIGVEIGEGVIAKGHGEVGEIEQWSESRRNARAGLFEQRTEFVQIVNPGESHSQATQPGLESLLDGLLDMKAEDFR